MLYLIFSLDLHLPRLLPPQASWHTWRSRFSQSGPVSLTHVCLRPCWATWGWTRPAGAVYSRNKPPSPRRRSPARPAQTQKTPPLPKWMAAEPREEPAPKKYLRETENPDTPRVPFHLNLLTPDPGLEASPHTGGRVGHPTVCSSAAAPPDPNTLFMFCCFCLPSW